MNPPSCPMPRDAVIDRYFMEHRAKLLDVAAFLDRCDRAEPINGAAGDDFRLAALRQAVGLLTDDQPERTRRILELLSDPSLSPIDAAPTKSAAGAHRPTPNP